MLYYSPQSVWCNSGQCPRSAPSPSTSSTTQYTRNNYVAYVPSGRVNQVTMYVSSHICSSKSMNQPGEVASPARGQLNRKNEYSLSAFVPDNLVSRDGFGSPVPRQPAHLHTQAESGAYLRDSSRVPRRRPFIHL